MYLETVQKVGMFWNYLGLIYKLHFENWLESVKIDILF